MSRISREKATNISKQEADRLFNENIEILKSRIEKTATDLFNSQFIYPDYPKSLIESLIDDRLIKSATSVRFKRCDKYKNDKYDNTHINLIKTRYPLGPFDSTFLVVDKDGVLAKCYNDLGDAESEKRTFVSKLTSAIIALSTKKKIISALPELARYFSDNNMAIVALNDKDISALRNSLRGN